MLLAVRYGAIERPPQLTTACTLAAGKLDRLDGRVRLFDVFTAPATGKATALLVLRDGLTGVFNHHHDAPQKTCSYTEEANVNRLVNIFLQSSLSLVGSGPPAPFELGVHRFGEQLSAWAAGLEPLHQQLVSLWLQSCRALRRGQIVTLRAARWRRAQSGTIPDAEARGGISHIRAGLGVRKLVTEARFRRPVSNSDIMRVATGSARMNFPCSRAQRWPAVFFCKLEQRPLRRISDRALCAGSPGWCTLVDDDALHHMHQSEKKRRFSVALNHARGCAVNDLHRRSAGELCPPLQSMNTARHHGWISRRRRQLP
jgi:hypothetical protein